MTFYDALIIALDRRGMTITELCEKSGLYHSYFSKLKSGHTKDVTWEKAKAICEALGMTPNDFLEIQSADKEER